jgi:hypothetical protein
MKFKSSKCPVVKAAGHFLWFNTKSSAPDSMDAVITTRAFIEVVAVHREAV